MRCAGGVLSDEEIEQLSSDMMSSDDVDCLCDLFKMFSDPTRLKILAALFEREMAVCDLAYLLNMSHSAISHQLASLRKGKLVKRRKEGKMGIYHLADDHVKTIVKMAYEHIIE